jgi:hypothetical protein
MRLSRFLDNPRGQSVENGAIEAVIDEDLWHYRSSVNLMARSLQIYQEVLQEKPVSPGDLDRRLQEVIELIAPEAEKKRTVETRQGISPLERSIAGCNT